MQHCISPVSLWGVFPSRHRTRRDAFSNIHYSHPLSPLMASITFNPCFEMESQYCQGHFKGRFNNAQVVYRAVKGRNKVNEILDKIIISSKSLKGLPCWIPFSYNANRTPKLFHKAEELQTNVQQPEHWKMKLVCSSAWSSVSRHTTKPPKLLSPNIFALPFPRHDKADFKNPVALS